MATRELLQAMRDETPDDEMEGETPMTETSTERRPTLRFYDPAEPTAEIELAFGYMNAEPTITVFKHDDVLVMLPRDVLEIALAEGWD